MTDDSSRRVVDALTTWLADRPAGTQLPSTRTLVAEHGASPVTVQKALRTLTSRGLIETRPGVGTFSRATQPVGPSDYGWQTAALGPALERSPRPWTALRTPPNDAIALHSGYPDRELLPERLVRTALGRAARSASAVQRPPVAGLPDLQAWFAAELGALAPPGINPPSASDVIVLPGSQAGLSGLFRTLVGRGEPLIIESPTYWGAIAAASQVGVQLVPVPSGPHGPDPQALARAFAETGARAFYAQPSFANPTGARWSSEVVEQVLALVREHGAFLIEDDWAHDTGIEDEATPVAARDDDGHVVSLRSLTKTVSPTVRVAGLVVRGPARERVLADVRAQNMYVSGVLQAAALDVVTHPGWRSHLRSLRQQLAGRRDLLVAAVAEHMPTAHLTAVPRGGFNLWLQLPEATDLEGLGRACEARGVIIATGDEWFPAEPTGRFLRLNYSGANPGSFSRAAQIIGEELER